MNGHAGFGNGRGLGRHEQANIEEFGDAAGGTGGVGDLMDDVSKARLEQESTMLPEIRDREAAHLAEEEKEGIHSSNYQCLLCAFGTDGAPKEFVSDGMKKVNELQASFKRKINQDVLDQLVANCYNKYIMSKLRITMRASARGTRDKITRAVVRHHRTICNKSDTISILWTDVDKMSKTMNFIFNNGFFTKPQGSDPDDTSVIQLNFVKSTQWLKFHKQMTETVKIIDQLQHTELRARNAGGNNGTPASGGRHTKKTKTAGSFTDLM